MSPKRLPKEVVAYVVITVTGMIIAADKLDKLYQSVTTLRANYCAYLDAVLKVGSQGHASTYISLLVPKQLFTANLWGRTNEILA